MKFNPIKFKKFREKFNLTQIQLSNQLNISQAAISSWEKGLRSPSNITINKIVSLFHISPEDIIDYCNVSEVPGIDDYSAFNNLEKLLIRKFRKLDEDGKLFMLEITPEKYNELKERLKNMSEIITDLNKQQELLKVN